MLTTNHFSKVLRIPCLILVGGTIGMSSAALANTAGKAIFVLGDVKALNAAHVERKLNKGDDLNSGDTIITSLKGQAHVQMTDGGMIAIRPGSEFHIENYAYDGKQDSDKSVFNLLKGGFRSITGAIGHANKAAYSVKTPVATIGIRGTDYLARLCTNDCGSTSSADGLYVTVLSGGIAVANDGGNIDVAPGQFGYVANSATTPNLMPTAPNTGLFTTVGSSTTTPQNTAIASSNVTQTQSISDVLSVSRTDSVPVIALPTQGTYSYTLTSTTMSPATAQLTIGTALMADFSAMTIAGNINVANNGDSWSGTTGSMKINNQDASFGGNFSSVNATLMSGTTISAGGSVNGNLAGPSINTANGAVPSGSVNFDMNATTGTGTSYIVGSATLH